MAQISIIKKSDIVEARRFDAEYFKPEYLKVERQLLKITHSDIYTLSKGQINYGLNIDPIYTDEGINFIRAQNLKEYGFDGEILKIPYNQSDFSESELLKEGDVIIVRSGANVGDIGITTKEYSGSTFGSYVIKINLKETIDPFFVYVFLKTKYGRKQTMRFRSGSAQPNISIPNLNQILVPILSSDFQELINNIFFKAKQKQTQSKQLYKEAEQLLLEELSLVDYKSKHQLTFSTTKKEIDESKRFDAEYFQPKYKEIIEKIENYEGGFDLVKNIVGWEKGVEVGSSAYTEQGKDFVRVSDFSIFGIESVEKKISENLFEKIREEYQPKKGEILFTKDGTIGLSYVLKEDLDGVLSGAFLRLSLKQEFSNFEKEVLALIFNSIIARLQVEQLSGGALIAHLKPSDFEKFKIPLIRPEIQKQIAEKIQQSHRLRKESKELLEEAKRKVEEEIESKNG